MKILLFTLAALAACLCVGVSAASARPPVITHIPAVGPFTFTVHGVCPFDFTDVNSLSNYTEQDYFDTNGNLMKINWEFSAFDQYIGPGGTTLFNSGGGHFHAQMVFDSNGNVSSDYGEGVIERVLLPDGSTFFAAGRADFLAHGSEPIYVPDWGHARNLAGFCAALGA
ncbi:MAG TPA: hypothetical protein VE088_01725 [Gaiellaceae bacterium]|jgi:hypothetical protein|nr:hypothetical protein [Gaiellaceae bacterium]